MVLWAALPERSIEGHPIAPKETSQAPGPMTSRTVGSTARITAKSRLFATGKEHNLASGDSTETTRCSGSGELSELHWQDKCIFKLQTVCSEWDI